MYRSAKDVDFLVTNRAAADGSSNSRGIMADSTREIRKHLMVMVGLILAIDAIAIAIFNAYAIGDAGRSTRTLFTGAWTVVTLAIVLNGLYRIRLARNPRAATRRR